MPELPDSRDRPGRARRSARTCRKPAAWRGGDPAQPRERRRSWRPTPSARCWSTICARRRSRRGRSATSPRRWTGPWPRCAARSQGTLARWAADGLFLTALRPFPMPVPYRPPEGGATRRLALGARARDPARRRTRRLSTTSTGRWRRWGWRETRVPGDAAGAPRGDRDDDGYGVFRDRRADLGRGGLRADPLPPLARDHGHALRAGAGRGPSSRQRRWRCAGPGWSSPAPAAAASRPSRPCCSGPVRRWPRTITSRSTSPARRCSPFRPGRTSSPAPRTLPEVRAVIAAEAEGGGGLSCRSARVPVGAGGPARGVRVSALRPRRRQRADPDSRPTRRCAS